MDVAGVFGVMSGLGEVCFHFRKVKIGVWSARATPRYLKTPQTLPQHAPNNVKTTKISSNRCPGVSYTPKWSYLI